MVLGVHVRCVSRHQVSDDHAYVPFDGSHRILNQTLQV